MPQGGCQKATLQTPLHKDTTRVQILAWLDSVTSGLTVTRDATREKVTAAADTLAVQVQRLETELQSALSRLAQAEQKAQVLEMEKAELLQRLAGAK